MSARDYGLRDSKVEDDILDEDEFYSHRCKGDESPLEISEEESDTARC